MNNVVIVIDMVVFVDFMLECLCEMIDVNLIGIFIVL